MGFRLCFVLLHSLVWPNILQGLRFNLEIFQDLAKELIGMFKPVKMGKVFFCNSGSEANDTQVTIAPIV